MRSQGLYKRMEGAERALMVEEPEWMKTQRAELARWFATVEEAAELYVEYRELVEEAGSQAAVLQSERGRTVTFAIVDSLWATESP